MINLSISKIKEFIKINKNEILLFICIFFITAISFGIGVLVAPEINEKYLKIESCSPNLSKYLDKIINNN